MSSIDSNCITVLNCILWEGELSILVMSYLKVFQICQEEKSSFQKLSRHQTSNETKILKIKLCRERLQER